MNDFKKFCMSKHGFRIIIVILVTTTVGYLMSLLGVSILTCALVLLIKARLGLEVTLGFVEALQYIGIVMIAQLLTVRPIIRHLSKATNVETLKTIFTKSRRRSK